MKSCLKIILACVAVSAALQTTAAEKFVRVFVLAGQSNMQGQGATNTLDWLGEDATYGRLLKQIRSDDGGWKTRNDVVVYYPRDAKKTDDAKQGGLTISSGANDRKIGPELFFGQVLGDHFDEPVLLVKTCWGGRSLATDFRPPSSGDETGQAYRDMITIVDDVMKNFGTHFPEWKTHSPKLTGFVWFQGWNDMIQRDRVDEYQQNLVNLINDVRNEWRSPALPVVIGTLGAGGKDAEENNERMRDIRIAQSAPAQLPKFKGTVAVVHTENYWDEVAYAILKKDWLKDHKWDDPKLKEEFDKMGNQPPYHYMGSAKVFSIIGHEFGNAMTRLLNTPKR